ncbi:unnamed protein product [Citrullus colocynthis]|uniref:Uncharacterized protein n=1 Tax=Citrullus colocynthis TaxID=252529 RepID=A0ABP0XQT8_9ROSI
MNLTDQFRDYPARSSNGSPFSWRFSALPLSLKLPFGDQWIGHLSVTDNTVTTPILAAIAFRRYVHSVSSTSPTVSLLYCFLNLV